MWAFGSAAFAAVMEYQSPAVWYGAVYAPVPVDFTAWSPGTPLLGQYPGTGLEFLVGDAQVGFDPGVYLTDGFGAVAGGGGDLWVGALQGTTALGFDHADGIQVELYDAAFNLVHTTGASGSLGAGNFFGLTSDVPFRYARLTDPLTGVVRVDNVHLAEHMGFDLRIAGTCPGLVDITIDGATPFGTIVLFTGSTVGSFVLPVGACAGTVTGVSARGARSLTYTGAGPAGGWFQYGVPVGRSLCGRAIQVLDQATCAVSNVALMP